MADTGSIPTRLRSIEEQEARLKGIANRRRPFKERLYSLLELREGSRVLDVGCGVGVDTIPLGKLVGPTGQVVGIDPSAERLARADAAATEAGMSAWVSHRLGDAYSLPFEDGVFDACHSERIFGFLDDPDAAIAEMVRVLRPGGMLAAVDYDGPMVGQTNTAHPSVERRLLPYSYDQRLNPMVARRHCFVGAQLYRWFGEAGLVEITFEVQGGSGHDAQGRLRAIRDMGVVEAATRAGAVTQKEADLYLADLEDLGERGLFVSYAASVQVMGRRP